MKNRFKIVLIIALVLIIIGTILGYLYVKKENEKKEQLKKQREIEERIIVRKNHYSENVVTNKESILYKEENNEYTEFGKINSGVKIKLSNIDINENTEYFHIDDMDLYISFEDVDPSDAKIKSDRYLNYIPFNQNIKTKATTTFYDLDDNYLFSINNSYDFIIYIKDYEKYGIVYNNELLYVHGDDVDSIYDNKNTDLTNKKRIKTLTYHAIYNPETTECTSSICQPLSMLESHLKYIRENDYFTLKLDELELYLDGKLQIPEKSIVLTIDDGTILDLEFLNLLEKYQSNATLFVITSWVDISNFTSKYLDLESHTHNMHNQYECPGYGLQGGGILCLAEDYVLGDLKTSQDTLGGSKYFAYPFFDFNDRAIRLLKEAGFKLAFIGQWDTDGYSYPNVTDRYKVRRKTIFSDTSMNEFISYLQ